MATQYIKVNKPTGNIWNNQKVPSTTGSIPTPPGQFDIAVFDVSAFDPDSNYVKVTKPSVNIYTKVLKPT